ncbi:asparaginase [Pelagibacterium montanilacus]|uniref:asparaginase n=1 Tax=Pelagibacterium montanilacus TaxID=2185280 RepID=UPI000F8E9A97|nr:asparaginase [Pelagibacterium montanilacus]
MNQKSGRERVLVVALGGTISMKRDASGGIVPALSGDDLVATVPGLAEVADIIVNSPFQIPGASLSLGQIADVSRLIADSLAGDFSGAIVVQGTDTIEETAFLLDCLLDADKPVVVTGAMRGAEAAGADGPANLLAAATVAASGARGTGTMVVLNDEVHSARFVRKGHTGLPSTFTSAPYGPIGHVMEGSFVQGMQPLPVSRISGPHAGDIPPVALLQVGLGDDGRLIEAVERAGFKGAVVSAMGAGHVSKDMIVPLETLARTMPVILSTRVVTGPVFEKTYGFPGSEIDLLGRGLIRGGRLGPIKARLLLQLLLASGQTDTAEIASAFAAR